MSAEPEGKEIGMKMAKATPADMDAAMRLNGMLSDVFEDRCYPRNIDGEFEENGREDFDEDDFECLRALYRRLEHVYRKQAGGMNRVVFGMSCLLMPENRLIDPDKSYLAPHPAIRWEENTDAQTRVPTGEGE